VGGNLVAVQASRLSTALHRQGKPGEFKDNAQYYASKICLNPYKVFCSKSMFFIELINNKRLFIT
jgi:solute carrier family 41